ncbi:MAG: hypothetical protein K2K04_06955, partial [Clostridia bacterium]|nr:hypothetical protein [Clostridia bacterium]
VTTAVSNYAGVLAEGAVDARVYTVSCDNVKIMHGDTDISGWYNISRRSSQLTINRRKLTITTGDAEKEYDGKPAENKQLTCENLIEGHVAAVNVSTLPNDTDVGEYKNELGVTVLAGTTDVTHNYVIDKENSKFGTLTITPRKLNVTTVTPDEAHTYDGKAYSDFDFEVAEKDKLGSGFTYKAVESSFVTQAIDVGEYTNEFKIEVFLNGKNVNKNFEFNYNYGTLTVSKRPLKVITVGDTKVYDGTPLTYKRVLKDNLAENQTLQEITPFSVTNVTAADGVEIAAKFTVVDGAERDVGKNYEINYENGKLIIEPLEISVKTVDASYEYNGLSFSNADYVATRLNAEGRGLYGEDALFPIFITARSAAGSEPNVCRYELPTFDGARSNYRIVGDIEYGTLTVTPKAVKVTINDVLSVYGEEIPDNGFVLDCGELPNGEELTFTTHYEMRGEIRTPETWEGYTLLNAGSYSIVYNDDAAIIGGNASVNNYTLKFVSGTLGITARDIVVTTATASHVYDGNDFSDTSYTTAYANGEGKGLLKDDKLTVNSYMTVRTIDDIPTLNTVTYKVPNSNYSIADTKYGELTIIPRPVIVYTGSATKPYDGTPLTCGEYDVKFAVLNETTGEWIADESEIGLVAGDELTLIGEPVSITDTCEIANANRFENGNYNIVGYVNGKLTVTKKQLHVKYAGGTITFEYGTAREPYFYTDEGFVYADSGEPVELVDGEKLVICWRVEGVDSSAGVGSVESTAYAPGVGSYTLKAYEASMCLGNVTYDRWGSPENLIGIRNYDVICDDAELEVIKRKVEVTVKDMTVTYGDSLPVLNTFKLDDEYTYPESVKSILEHLNQILEFEFGYKEENVKDVGTYHFDVKSVTAERNCYPLVDIDESNYDVTCSGTLTITPKEITVQP